MKLLNKFFAVIAALAAVAAGPFAYGQTQTSLTVKDGNGTTQSLCNVTSATGSVLIPCSDAYTQGAPVTPTNQLPVYAPTSLTGPTVTFTRPANTTAYAATDLVANSTTAGSVVPLTFTGLVRAAGECYRIERVDINVSSTTLTNAQFKVFFFDAAPTVTVGDGAVFESTSALSTSGAAGLRGTAYVSLSQAATDGAWGVGTPLTAPAITVCPASGTTIYAVIEATAAYTPTSGETVSLTLEGFRP